MYGVLKLNTTIHSRELKDEGPKDGLCKPKYRAATLITLLKAADLEKMEKGGMF